MPDKEGAEEKTTKSVVSKRQKQMMGEEGYDVARDMGRVKPSKDKKDATSYPVSDEVKKTQKVNKGPSALERVKKKYKGQIMDVKKEELDLTQVAEAFGGYIVEAPSKDMKDAQAASDALSDMKKDSVMGKTTPEVKKGVKKAIRKVTAPKPGDIAKEKQTLQKFLNQPDPEADSVTFKASTDKKALADIGKRELEDTITSNPKVTTSGGSGKSKSKITGDTKPKQGNIFGGQDEMKSKRKSGSGRPRGSRPSIPTAKGQLKLDLKGTKGKQSPRMYKKGDTVRTDLRTVTRTRRARKATPKELERTKEQVAATDKKEKKKLRTPSAFERAIGTAPKKGDVPRKRTKPGIAGVIQRVKRFKKAGGPEKLKTYAKTKGIEGLKYAKANPLAAVVAAGQLVDTIAPRLPKLQKPKLDVGVVGRRTAG